MASNNPSVIREAVVRSDLSILLNSFAIGLWSGLYIDGPRTPRPGRSDRRDGPPYLIEHAPDVVNY